MTTELIITARVEGKDAISQEVAEQAMKAAHEKCVCLQKPLVQIDQKGQMSYLQTRYEIKHFYT